MHKSEVNKCVYCGDTDIYKYGSNSNPICYKCANGGGRYNPPYIREKKKIGRNELCSCGSDKKYKKCCGK